MVNERKTESIVRSRLVTAGYFDDPNLWVEEQKSDYPRIQKLLKHASKSGSGAGFPEFIISSRTHSDFLIVIECKADETKHASENLNRYSDYAVDGALLYASYLAKEFDVLTIAVSGETEPALRISHYLHLRGTNKAVEFPTAFIPTFAEYYNNVVHSDLKYRQDYETLIAFSRELNNHLQAEKIKESDRGLLIFGILVALDNNAFRASYRMQTDAKDLAGSLVSAILNEFQKSQLPPDRIASLRGAFAFIELNTTLTTEKISS